MSTYVVDASVAVKWFVSESDSEMALLLLTPSCTLIAPDYLWLEVSSVVCQRIQRKQLLTNEGLEILPALQRFDIQLFSSADLLGPATRIAIETSTSFYDCLYLALAVSQSGQMVTADRKFYLPLARTHFADHLLWIGDLP